MTVFLDLDGTLVDPKEGIVAAATHALQALGLTVPDDLSWIIGPPLVESFAKLGAKDPHAALSLYRSQYGAGGLLRATVYPGIPTALESLARHHALYLATAKPHVYAKEITAHFGLDSHLSGQFGPELDGTRNDKGELLAYACQTLGIAPNRAIMIGDRDMDLRAAQANGLAFIGVEWGYARETELDGADLLCTHPSDLPKAVASLG